MLGQPGQSALRVPYKRQPVFQATHRCVSQRLSLSTHTVCEIAMLHRYSGGVSAKALQQLQGIKCLRLHAIKCLCKLCVQAGECTCMLKSAYHPLLSRQRRRRAAFPLPFGFSFAEMAGININIYKWSSLHWNERTERENESETDTYCSAS